MSSASTYIFYLTLFLKVSVLFSQANSFGSYMANFKKAKLPLAVNASTFEKISKNDSFITDSAVSEFIGPKFYPPSETHYLHFYYTCPIKNDSITVLMYLKTAAVQGELWLMEIALYNSKTKKRVDKMLLAQYRLSAENDSGLSDDSAIECSPAEIRKDLSIKTQTGLFIPTLKGFKVIEGIKEEATNW